MTDPIEQKAEAVNIADCGDHSCVVAEHKSGQRTNGGCRCGQRELRRAVIYWRGRVGRIEGERDEALEALRELLHESTSPDYSTSRHSAAIVHAERVLSARGQEVRKVSVPPEILSRKAPSPYVPADDGLLHDSPHKDIGRGRPAKAVRGQKKDVQA